MFRNLHRRAQCAVAHEFMGLANTVLAGTNHLLHAEHQLARQVMSKEKELAALRQRSAILTAETVKLNQSEAELKAAHESKVSTRYTRMRPCCNSFQAFSCVEHILLQTKELREVEQAIIDATRVSTEPPAYTSSIGCLQPCLLYTSPSPRDRTRSRMPSSA